MSKTHQLFAFIVAFIWGTNFVFIKMGLDELPPFLFAAIRFTMVALPLVFILPKVALPPVYIGQISPINGIPIQVKKSL